MSVNVCVGEMSLNVWVGEMLLNVWDAKMSMTGCSSAEQVDGQGSEFRQVDVQHHLHRLFTQAGAFAHRPAERVPIACGEAGVDIDQQLLAARDDGRVEPGGDGEFIPHREGLAEFVDVRGE